MQCTHHMVSRISLLANFQFRCTAKLNQMNPPVYLHSIFEISSVTRIFFNFKISSLKNWKINLISKLIFAGYTGSRNQVQTRKKIKLVLNSIFFQVWNKLRNPKFENRVQRDRAIVCITRMSGFAARVNVKNKLIL